MKTPSQYRAIVRDLICEAVPEGDEMRRRALLTMADQWVELAAPHGGLGGAQVAEDNSDSVAGSGSPPNQRSSPR